MKTETLILLQSLLETYGPSGQEDETRDLCQKILKPLVNETWVDDAGNLIGKLNGQDKSAPAIRIMVHMDEIGMIVKRINDDGTLRVDPLGGSYPASFGQGLVDILGNNECFSGVLSFGSMHTTKESPQTNKIMPKEFKGEGTAPFWDNVFITTRKSLKELADAGVHPGTRVVIAKSRRILQQFQDCIAGYFLDNRAAIAIAIEAIKKVKKQQKDLQRDVYIVATCSEEIGAIGACYASRTLPGDISIAIDVGPVSTEYQTKLNSDPIIVYKDTEAVYDKHISDHILRLGKELKLNPQCAVFSTYASDASISKSKGQSAKAALLCFPVENTHGYEIAHKDSLANCADLLSAYLLNPTVI
ncbi:MAG: peptidase M42 [Chlamydiae bacterium CG10_big_fil_rev_8_21_14_0_10_35_9]|nr:MAG: peptidase M42 [Chlamydiae bacterium CG10_big_fil_rev_8_21_14_0_10_35_9]